MPLTQEQQNRIGEVVKDILLERIDDFPELGAQICNAPFHSAFLECFRERHNTSWLHGLNTSLESGFENISHILSGGYKRRFTGPFTLKVKTTQASQIENLMRDLESDTYLPNLNRENDLIYNYPNTDQETDSLPFTVDTYIERENEIVAIEMKSVRPNSGEGRGEKQKILYGKAALKLQNPEKDIKFLIGFPFDPTSEVPTGYNKERFFDYLIEFKKFFAQEEVLIAGELWDFLSGNNETMSAILDVIAETVSQVRN